MTTSDTPLPETKAEDSASSRSSITLPMAAEAAQDDNDIEKTATHKSDSAGQPANKVVTALDWTGPDDPENPENWSTGWKAYHVAYVGIQCFVMYVSHQSYF